MAPPEQKEQKGTEGQADTEEPDLDDPANLKIIRRQWKSAITRHLGSLRRFMAEGDEFRVNDRLQKLKVSFDELEFSHETYEETLTTEAEMEESEAWFAEVETNYIAGIKAARKWLGEDDSRIPVSTSQFQATQNTATHVVTNVATNAATNVGSNVGSIVGSNVGTNVGSISPGAQSHDAQLINLLSIPKLEIDKFNGNPLEFQSFMSIFDETVSSKISDDQVKLTRLLQFTTGPAKEAIRNCALIGGTSGYKQARDILQQRFGNDHLISKKVFDELVNGKSVSKSTDLRKLADDLSMAFAVLKSLSLTHEIDNQNTVIQIVQRCPKPVQSKWRNKALEIKQDSGSYPKFEVFVNFMSKIASDWCDPVYGGDAMKTLSDTRTKASSVNAFSAQSNSGTSSTQKYQSNNVTKCVCCGQNHRLIYCDIFKAMKPVSRWKLAKDKRLCYNCLLTNHVSSACKNQSVCSVPNCGKRHSKFLHTDIGPASSVPDAADTAGAGASGNEVTGNGSCGSTSAFGSNVYLPIVELSVNGTNVNALLDTGSTNTFVTEKLAKSLNLKGYKHNYVIKTVSKNKPTCSQVVKINVSSTDGSFSQDLSNVLVVPNIPAKYPENEIDLHKFPHLSDLEITSTHKGVPVDVLIGMDNSHLLIPLDVRCNPSALNEPYATRSVFGWALNGHIGENNLNEISSNFVQLDQKIERIWQLETNDFDDKSMSVSDQSVLDLWDKEISRDNGHYVVPIPWKKGYADLPNNKVIAQHRLNGLIKRLDKADLTDVYDTNMRKMVDSGYAERVPENQLKLNNHSVWYIPHHPVLKKAGKVRPVFDCSAQYKGISLNGECYQGPNLTNDLLSVLLRFRQYKYAIMADIECMYLQVRIPESDRNALRYLWYNSDKTSIVEYRMTSHLFGGVWCASSSSYALHRTVTDCQPDDLISDTILRSFYVDDLLKSVKTREEAYHVIHDTKSVLKYGGFNLTKFIVNDESLLEQIDFEDRAKEIKQIVPDTYCKALGIQWEINDDVFYYCNKGNEESGGITRRKMLSYTYSMYDPLGLIAPIVLQGKILFQQTTRLKIDWDDPVPYQINDKWDAWLRSLQNLEQLKFKRCVLPDGFSSSECVCEIHHFSDASTIAYGAVSYLRAINRNGEINVSLLAAKGRLAPLKDITVPRLELSAAVVSVKLDQLLRRELDLSFTTSYFWTDSTICLAYIQSENKRFKTFVANRVSQIRQVSEPNNWNHIPGVLNPADVLSRGCVVNNVPDSWFRGPDFLWDYKSNWPQSSVDRNLLQNDIEVTKDSVTQVCQSHHTVASDDIHTCTPPLAALIAHYSSYYRLKKAVCWLTRFIQHLKGRSVENGPIKYTEMKIADTRILRFVQFESFRTELDDLKVNGKVKRSSALRKLSPVLENQLIVVGGRLSHAPIPMRAKYPIILPADHKVSLLIASDFHNSTHLGTEWVLSKLRTRYWIIRARALIKRIKQKCVTCKRLYAKPMVQKMADLPPERCTPHCAPFSSVGVDLFGPFYVIVGRSQVKRYGCVFSCFQSRAVHIEKLDDLSTDAFINGFIRFCARRGQPDLVRSDNGTNLVGARNELSRSFRLIKRNAVIQAARQRDIEWVFNPPLASHHGGLYERMIRTIRRVLYAILHTSSRLSDDVLNTVFCECENIVNSRPITKCSDDTSDDEPLTPNHLLLMRGNYSVLWTTHGSGNMYQRKWRQVQHFVDLFWKRWTKQYLPELNRRQKWQDVLPNVSTGDIVLVMDENSPRGLWPLARVTDVTTGRDGLVRSIKLKTKSTELVRPITKIVLLESVSE